jgi:hypothetical protein
MPILGIIASQISGKLNNNSYESIATVNVGVLGSTTVSFTSIPSTYKHLQIRAIAFTGTGGGYNNFMQFNGDTGNNYAWHFLQGNGTVAGAGASTTTSSMIIGKDGVTGGGGGANVIDILDYTNTNKYKTTRHLNGYDFNGSGIFFYSSGLWQNTAAVSSISITTAGTTFAQYSQFALYGVKG